jgi:hypothetical protein
MRESRSDCLALAREMVRGAYARRIRMAKAGVAAVDKQGYVQSHPLA